MAERDLSGHNIESYQILFIGGLPSISEGIGKFI
jgi:hypothetical protein